MNEGKGAGMSVAEGVTVPPVGLQASVPASHARPGDLPQYIDLARSSRQLYASLSSSASDSPPPVELFPAPELARVASYSIHFPVGRDETDERRTKGGRLDESDALFDVALLSGRDEVVDQPYSGSRRIHRNDLWRHRAETRSSWTESKG